MAKVHSLRQRRAVPAGTPSALVPADVAALYHLDTFYANGFYGQGEAIAFVEFAAPRDADDRAFWRRYSLAPGMNRTVATVDPGGLRSEAAAVDETDLDLQYAGALAPGAALTAYLVDGSLALGPFATAVWRVLASIAQGPARIVSISLGAGEEDVARAGPFLDPVTGTSHTHFASFAAALDAWIVQAGLQVFVAAGDSGAYAAFPVGTTPEASWPAVQAAVVAVGGTQLIEPAVVASGEEAWGGQTLDPLAPGYGVANTLPQASGGGGPSLYLPAPAYQAALARPTRETPDVAAFAGPLTIVDQGQTTPVWGTSAAAPITAAIAALYHQATGQALDHSLLYAGARDVTRGNDSNNAVLGAGLSAFYRARVGYDRCTGAGTPDALGLLGL